MTLRVTIRLSDPNAPAFDPVYYTIEDGVHVGPGGELHLVAEESESGAPLEFCIYAAGAWKAINVVQMND